MKEKYLKIVLAATILIMIAAWKFSVLSTKDKIRIVYDHELVYCIGSGLQCIGDGDECSQLTSPRDFKTNPIYNTLIQNGVCNLSAPYNCLTSTLHECTVGAAPGGTVGSGTDGKIGCKFC